MEPVYQIVTQPGADAYRAYAKAHVKSHGGRRPVLSVLAGISLIGISVLPWIRYGFSLLYLLTLLIGLGCLLAEPLALPLLTRKLLRALPPDPVRLEYKCYPDTIQLRFQGSKDSKPYDAILQGVESRDYYFLYVSRSLAYILPKADFTLGDPAAFSAFLSAHGVTVMPLDF